MSSDLRDLYQDAVDQVVYSTLPKTFILHYVVTFYFGNLKLIFGGVSNIAATCTSDAV